jgi:hypothetical protein
MPVSTCSRWNTPREAFDTSWITPWSGIASSGSMNSSITDSSTMPPAMPRMADSTAVANDTHTRMARTEVSTARAWIAGRWRSRQTLRATRPPPRRAHPADP